MEIREQFSAYLDGALNGRSMGLLVQHLEACSSCAADFAEWQDVQAALVDLGPAVLPQALQSQLRDVLASELEQGRHLSPASRFLAFWRGTLMPTGLRLSAGLAGALLLVSGLTWVVGTAAPVQANDDRLAHLNAPTFLYSVTPPAPIATGTRFVAVLVDAKVNAEGRVYDYRLIAGPDDLATRVRIEANLEASIFKPATVFGTPVRGHAVMTYTSVSVHG